jgi:hypothetical protein
MQKLKIRSTFLLAGNRIIKKNNIFAKVNFNYFNQMKKTLLIIASALFLTLMGVSCCDCDCGENKGNGDNSNATTETVNETKGTDAGQNAEAPKTQSQEKNLLIKRADIDKVNKFIDEGKCGDAVAIINSWTDKRPDDGIKLLRDINIGGACTKEVGDAINALNASINK